MKKLIYLIVLIVVLGLIVSGCIPVVPPAEQNEPGSLPNKSPGELYVPGGYTTIQLAINAASPGDTIIVAAGTYAGNVNVNKSVTVLGAGYASTKLQGSDTGTGFTISADNVTIDGFEITNFAYGVSSGDTDGSTISNNKIHDMNNTGYAGIGIMFWTGTNSVDFDNNNILDNIIYNNDRQGIFVGNYLAGTPGISEWNTISRNKIYDNGRDLTTTQPDASQYGIQLTCADNNTIENNEIYGHDTWIPSSGPYGMGIYLWASFNNTVTGNVLHDNHRGIQLWNDWSGRTLASNQIRFNNIYNNSQWGLKNSDAIAVDATCNWWGADNGPGVIGPGNGDKVYGNVDYNPWLTEGASLVCSAPPQPTTSNVILEATLSDSTLAGISGMDVDFYLDDIKVGYGTTDSNGVARFVGLYPVGVYEVYASTICDLNLKSEIEYLAVYDPSAGFVTGGGWIDSPAGAYLPEPSLSGKATFGFVSKYKQGATVPTGNTEFQFKAGNLNFHSDNYDWLVVAGDRAKYKGTGTINGAGDYGFMLTATDSDPDLFRIKIQDKINGDVIYDNKMGSDDKEYDGTELGGGQIIVHKGK